MRSNQQISAVEARLRAGHFIRELLRPVRPEHVPDMMQMFYLFEHGGKKITVPESRWLMAMPHGYSLRGEGPVGVAIEPPRTLREPNPTARRYNDLGTEDILRLCAQARRMKRPERDQVITQLYALNLTLCDVEAVEAIELLTYDLIDGAVR